MKVHLEVRNESSWKRLCRADKLTSLAAAVCEGEGVRQPVELSLLFCDDPFMRELNTRYRRTDRPTDVLSFAQEAPVEQYPRVLGDVVISLETVARHCDNDRAAMREEVRLLFCHGLLHLLGSEHGTEGARREMVEKQARYLGITEQAAWRTGPA